MTLEDEARTQEAGGSQLLSSQEPSSTGGHQTSWWRLTYLFSSPSRDLSLSRPGLKPHIHPKECLLKLVGLERGGLLFICFVLHWLPGQLSGEPLVSLSPIISLLGFKATLSAALGLSWSLTLQRPDSWRGQIFLQLGTPECRYQTPGIACPSPTSLCSHQGWLSITCSFSRDKRMVIKRETPMEPRSGEFTE